MPRKTMPLMTQRITFRASAETDQQIAVLRRRYRNRSAVIRDAVQLLFEQANRQDDKTPAA